MDAQWAVSMVEKLVELKAALSAHLKVALTDTMMAVATVL